MKKILLLILFLGIVLAETSPSGNSACSVVTNPDGTQTVNMSDPNCAQTLDYKAGQCQGVSILSANFLGCLADTIMYNTVFTGISDATKWLLNTIISILLYTPDVSAAKADYDSVLRIVQSLYSLLIAGMGLYWVWGARSVEGRMQAKEWSERLISLVLLEAVGFFVFGMALKLNGYITSSVLSEVQDSMSGILSTAGVVIAVLVVYALMLPVLTITVITLVVRQLLIFSVLMIFPFTLMLYMVPATRQWGSLALNVTLTVIFAGAVDAIIVFSMSGASHLADFFAIDVIIRPIAMIGMFALLGPINIWLFMNAPRMASSTSAVVRVISEKSSPVIEYVREKTPVAVHEATRAGRKMLDPEWP